MIKVLRRLVTAISGLLLIALGVAAIYQGVIHAMQTGVQRNGLVTFGNWDAAAHSENRALDEITLQDENPAWFWSQVGLDGLGGLVCILIGGFIVVTGLTGKLGLKSVEVTRDDRWD
jgi:hypothetical protein